MLGCVTKKERGGTVSLTMKKEPQTSFITKLRNKNRKEPLSREQLNYYVKLAQQGSIEARNHVVEKNIGLVLQIAGKQYSWAENNEDYFQEGVLGLIRAVKTYNPDRGLEFSTYATWWIKQKMQRHYMDTHHIIRVPVYAQQLVREYAKIVEQNPKLKKSKIIQDLAQHHDMPTHAVKALVNLEHQTFSINVENEDGAEWEPEQDDTSWREQLDWLDVDYLLTQLEFRQYRIMRARLQGETLLDIARRENISRERVRQIQEDALVTMKTIHNLRSPE